MYVCLNCVIVCIHIFNLYTQVEQDASISESSPHIANIGRMVEDMENKIRNVLNEIYFGKTKDIVNGLRSNQSLSDQRQQLDMKKILATELLRRNVKGDEGEITN